MPGEERRKRSDFWREVRRDSSPYEEVNRVANTTVLRVLTAPPSKSSLIYVGGRVMTSWTVACSNCDSRIFHSQVLKRNLAELLLPSKPDVEPGATITCPQCQTVVSYTRTDLRYSRPDSNEVSPRKMTLRVKRRPQHPTR